MCDGCEYISAVTRHLTHLMPAPKTDHYIDTTHLKVMIGDSVVHFQCTKLYMIQQILHFGYCRYPELYNTSQLNVCTSVVIGFTWPRICQMQLYLKILKFHSCVCFVRRGCPVDILATSLVVVSCLGITISLLPQLPPLSIHSTFEHLLHSAIPVCCGMLNYLRFPCEYLRVSSIHVYQPSPVAAAPTCTVRHNGMCIVVQVVQIVYSVSGWKSLLS